MLSDGQSYAVSQGNSMFPKAAVIHMEHSVLILMAGATTTLVGHCRQSAAGLANFYVVDHCLDRTTSGEEARPLAEQRCARRGPGRRPIRQVTTREGGCRCKTR